MKFNYKLIVIILLVTGAILFLIYSFIGWQQQVLEKRASCAYLNEARYGESIDPVNLVDCFGIFSIEQESLLFNNKRSNLYYIRDNKNDYNIAILDTLSHYKMNNGIMYIYEPLIFPEDEYSHIQFGDQPWQYPQKYFINGKLTEINYYSPQDFPNYLKVEMSSGEVTLYNTYGQMPEEAKTIFQELESE